MLSCLSYGSIWLGIVYISFMFQTHRFKLAEGAADGRLIQFVVVVVVWMFLYGSLLRVLLTAGLDCASE